MIWVAVKFFIFVIIAYKIEEYLLQPFVVDKHYPGVCSQVKGINFGSKDLAVTKDGMVFITSGVWFPPVIQGFNEFLKSNDINGIIFLYDFNKPNLGARKLKIIPSKDFDAKIFHPSGISLLEDETNGNHLLYIINRREYDDDAVEKFRYSPELGKLIHLKSFTGDELHVTSDLAVLAEDKFYVANFLYYKNPYLRMFEILFPFIGFGSLVFFNGTGFAKVNSSMNSPHGLFLSRDNRILYMASPRQNSVKAFEINDDYSVAEIQYVGINTSPENLHLSQSGDALYTGAHPVIYKFIHNLGDFRLPSPSSVLKLPLKDGKIVPEEITEIFYDHGNLISASTIAAVYNKTLLIGSVIHKLVICYTNSTR